ncbi:Protein OPAQUE10-like protein [Vigna angularis]|uniref:Protein OPAQUE10-like protein n=2 Tax=Phaseolus angularis TaxID=3914 RepID=A0A8T0LI46_PHAAN|nr:uncharacterized protein LOC108323853 [Vigna angularis]XP_052735471.1 uncharacterized protein LOC108323853 [Vigna angularis]KAG2410668.1 Protein OPAQUE10-like protein [Vigna angularis]BAT73207.1 hypothetical protein VIGAN_01067400 [Vigna angularis var. angularis]
MVCEVSSSQTAPSTELFTILSSSSSSSSSAESNFRQLDDAFLQTQTRIWLGEVLQMRLDEQLIISELLADGELLFQVSKVVWKLLSAKHMELRHIKAYKIQSFTSKKNIARYRPYSNVDSFLKICKILGLTGVDLFSPSDVVERRNTRKVCMCIRSFSKKSRSMKINVPDFDIVTCMVTMPKALVGCMRRSIELSHSIPADSSGGYYLQKHARRSRQGYPVTASTKDFETYLDQYEDPENKHLVLQFDELHTDDLYDYTSEIDYNIASPMAERICLPEDLAQLDIQEQQRNGIYNDFELLCSMESLQYHCSEDIEHDCELTWSSSPPSGDLRTGIIHMSSHLDTKTERVQESRRIVDFDYFENLSLSSNGSVNVTPKNDKIPCKRDASSLTKDRKDPDLFHEENGTPNVYQSASSHGSNPTPQTAERVKFFETCDDKKKVLVVACMNCYSREDIGDQVDAESNFRNIESSKVHNDKNDRRDKIKEEHESQGMVRYRDMPYQIISNAGYSCSVKKFEETYPSLYSPDCYFCSTNSPDRVVPRSNDTRSTSLKNFLAYEERESQVGLSCSDNASCCQSGYEPESCKWDQKGKCAITSYKDNKSSCSVGNGSHEEIKPCIQKNSEVLSTIVKLDTDGKELNIDSLPLASNAVVLGNCEKPSTRGDDPNDFSRGDAAQYIGDGGQRVLDMIINDVVVPVNCDEVVSLTESFTASLSPKHGFDPVSRSEHTCAVHVKDEINPEDERVHLENVVGTKEGGEEIPKEKPQKKKLLRSVLGGAAAVGLLFMILHLRRNGGEKAAQPSMASSHIDKVKIQKKSDRKVTRSTKKGVYPAEKITLK